MRKVQKRGKNFIWDVRRTGWSIKTNELNKEEEGEERRTTGSDELRRERKRMCRH